MLELCTLWTITQAQYRGHQSIFGNQVLRHVYYWIISGKMVNFVYISIITRLLIDTHHYLIWLTVSDGFCPTAEKEPVLFGYNSTSGCLLPVSWQNLTQCHVLRSVAQHEFMIDLNLYVFVLK